MGWITVQTKSQRVCLHREYGQERKTRETLDCSLDQRQCLRSDGQLQITNRDLWSQTSGSLVEQWKYVVSNGQSPKCEQQDLQTLCIVFIKARGYTMSDFLKQFSKHGTFP